MASYLDGFKARRRLEEFDNKMRRYFDGNVNAWISEPRIHAAMTGDVEKDHHIILTWRYNLHGAKILPDELALDYIMPHRDRSKPQPRIAGVPDDEMHPTQSKYNNGHWDFAARKARVAALPVRNATATINPIDLRFDSLNISPRRRSDDLDAADRATRRRFGDFDVGFRNPWSLRADHDAAVTQEVRRQERDQARRERERELARQAARTAFGGYQVRSRSRGSKLSLLQLGD